MSEHSYGPVVSSIHSSIVKTIVDQLGIKSLPVLRMTLDFQPKRVVTLSIDVALTESLDTAISSELQRLQFLLMQPTEQVTEQVKTQED